MPFFASHLYLRATPAARALLTAHPLLSRNLYHLPAASLERCAPPPEGLLAARDLVAPETIRHPDELPWDALWAPPGAPLHLPPPERCGDLSPREWPPEAALRALAALAEEAQTPLCLYCVQMHGGDVDLEAAWAFAPGARHTLLALDQGAPRRWSQGHPDGIVNDVLQSALSLVGVQLESGWFGPHTGTFDWGSRRVGEAAARGEALGPVPGSLYRALQLGDLEEALACVGRGVALNRDGGRAALELAALSGEVALVEALVGAGVELGRGHWSPLASCGSVSLGRWLLEAGVPLRDDPNPLIEVARRGADAVARWLVGEGAAVEVGRDHGLWFGAASGGLVWLLERLLRAGAALERREPGRWMNLTAAELAAHAGRLEALRWLVGQGAAPGEQAVALAAEGGHAQVVAWLLERGLSPESTRFGRSALVEAAAGGHVAVIDRLVAAGAEVNRPGYGGETALMVAALWARPAAVARLLAVGAEVNAAQERGHTALWSAVGGGDEEVVALLLGAGARIEGVEAYGTTLREFARSRGVSLERRDR